MASKSTHLRVAKPGEKPKKAEPKSITEALDGTGRDVLVAMRKALAKKLDADAVSSNSIASAYKELRELDRLIRVAEFEAEDDADARSDIDDTFDAEAL